MTGARVLDSDGLELLVVGLRERGYEVWGPQVRDGVIVHSTLETIEDLPLGWTDEQAGGRYRLVPRSDGARFGYAVGPRSLKEVLHEPRQRVWAIRRVNGELAIEMDEPEPVSRAFLGARPCEVAAVSKQDRILADGPHSDPAYKANREDLFIVAVDCGDPAATCFCTSLGTGPSSDSGYDVALTELPCPDPDALDTRYVARAGSERGRQLLAALPSSPATADDRRSVERVEQRAVDAIVRKLDTDRIREVIYDNLESGQWADIAERCLACGNCTLVCPTCFCTNLEDVTDLSGDTTTRWRVWDTCYSTEFSHLGPGPVRASTAARYRQWFMHKLGSWIDQFGESGCVGCGRCITWCPVGIDLTAELAAMRADAGELP